MNNDDAIDNAIDALDEFLTRAIDALPITAFEISSDDANAIIASIPESMIKLSDALYDAFIENIPDFTSPDA
jgi:hypothetical protein